MVDTSSRDRISAQAGTVGDFSHVRDWIFDLDNTLYRADNGIFAQIDGRMTQFVARLLGMARDEARQIQKQLYRDHGTTLAGLIAVHRIDPEPYLHFVHDIDLSDLAPDPDLAAALARLPGRRFVFTNGCRNHAARILARNALRAVEFAGAERTVRINQLPLGLADLEEIIPEQPDMVLIPKTERAEQVAEVDRKIAELKQQHRITRPIWLMPILESALGIENAFAVAAASPNVAAVTIGLEDYTADLGVVKTSEGAESFYARTRLVNAARAAGVQAIDSVYGDVADMDGLLRWGQKSRALGFEGMGCVHPLQIAVVHQAFAPTPAEIEKAQRIVAAFEEAQQRGLGVVSLGSKMIDPPVVQRALKLVKRAREMGLVQ